MNDYEPNSHRFKEESKNQEERQKQQKVVNGRVKTRKRNEFGKFTDAFISEDLGNVKSFIIMDVLIPAAKKVISDVVTNSIDMILYGGSGRSSSRDSNVSRVSYRSYYDRKDDRPRYENVRNRTGYNYDDIIVDSRGEGEEVLARLDEMIDTYGVATVADLHDLVGITGNYTDNKYGWTNIRNAEVVRVRDGYMLKMPKAMPIN